MIVILAADLEGAPAALLMKLKNAAGQSLSDLRKRNDAYGGMVIFNGELFLNDHPEQAKKLGGSIALLQEAGMTPQFWENANYDDPEAEAEPSELDYILNVLDNAEGDFE